MSTTTRLEPAPAAAAAEARSALKASAVTGLLREKMASAEAGTVVYLLGKECGYMLAP
jgi:hypothetical protein